MKNSYPYNLVRTAKAFLEKYDRRIGIALMATGFIVDNLTLRRIDLPLENLILGTYLSIALAAILLINAYQSGKLQNRFMHKIHVWFPLPMQYAFGALFSGFVVFYSRSASFIASWPFLVMLAGLLIGNEFARTRYARFAYHITVFYAALFSFAIFYVPVIAKRIGASIFLLSGIASLLGIAVVLLIIRSFARDRFKTHLMSITVPIVTVFALFNLLYFTNIIPPIPLSLKAIGAYHNLKAQNGVYTAQAEAAPWYRFFNDTSHVFHRTNSEPVFVFSAVFAPTKLTTPIFHRWSHYDEESKRWRVTDRVSFSIVGGRDGGYRGYSRKQSIQPGKWRVDVITSRNQLVGRITFMVTDTESAPETQKVNL